MTIYTTQIIEKLHLISEELKLCVNLDVVVNEQEKRLELDTVAGKIIYTITSKNYMEDVYRFIMIYGSKLYSWGKEARINESKKQTKEN